MWMIILACFQFLLNNCEENHNKSMIRSLFLQRSSVPSAKSWARLLTPFPKLDHFSVCYRIRLNRFREESTIMSYAVSDGQDNEIRMDHRYSGFKVAFHSTWAKTNITTPLHRWSHFCITYNSFSEEWKIYVDGQIMATGIAPNYNGSLEAGGTYIIGQEQDSLGGDFHRDQSFSGEITELNFWSKILDSYEIQKASGCTYLVEGDILAWSHLKWEINGETEWILIPKKDLCDTNQRNFAVFPDRLSIQDAVQLCEVAGGIVAIPQNIIENDIIYEISKKYTAYCSANDGASYLWLGANDIQTERTWIYTGNQSPISWEGPWRGDGPNGGIEENCMVMLSGEFPAQWSDIACLDTYHYCVVCEFNTLVPLYLKGPILCSNSPFNYEYFISGMRNDKPLIIGIFHSEIYWDDNNSSWNLVSLKNDKVGIRYHPIKGQIYPFGKNLWVMDIPICGHEKSDTVYLTLSSCKENEFTCHDGSCISLENRCDHVNDCHDSSDESDCSPVILSSGYKSIIHPTSNEDGTPLPIFFSISILSFPAIKTQELVFETFLELKLKWKDRRLNYKNLKMDRTLNTLPDESVAHIWKPTVFLKNSLDNMYTNLKEGTSTIQCIAEGNYFLGPRYNIEEMKIFPGSENSLEMSEYFRSSYACDFHLLMFPFDTQVCHMNFIIISASSKYVNLVPEYSGYNGSYHLIEYGISQISLSPSISNGYSLVTVNVRFTRRYGYYLLTLYIPSILIVFIAYATLFFNPADFNSRIIVALTSLLVLVSLFSQTSNSLPKTSYFKLVDIWLFFAIVMIFIIVAFQTVSEFFSYENMFKNRMSRRLLKIDPKVPLTPIHVWQENDRKYLGLPLNICILYAGRIFIPLLFLVFNLSYWGVALKYLILNVWPYEEL